ncbi:MAG: phage terminase large subunit family protein, partial [Acidobacteria bacterium Pan2503]|nr:phage terminase large subunit family protein [Candidatus Acidoferrum panamensis]
MKTLKQLPPRNVFERYGRVYRKVSERAIYEWAREQIKLDSTSPIQGNYDIENSPQFRPIFDAYQRDDVRMITTVGPNQGGRTKAMEIASLWAVVHRPGPMQWNTDTNDKARDFAEERWWPMARTCVDVVHKMPTRGAWGKGSERYQERVRKVIFSDGMPFLIQGCSESNLEQKSIMNQFNDECWQWPLGRLEIAWIRCNVAYGWNYKVWNGSVAGCEGDDFDLAFRSGTMQEWHWRCLKCGLAQIP